MPGKPATIDDIVAEWKQIRSMLVRELELLKSGKMGTGDRVLLGTVAKTLERVKRSIAEFDVLIAEHKGRDAKGS